jgi:hypothetical protein
MKKVLLFVMIVGIAFSSFAQKQYQVKKDVKMSKDIVDNGVKNNLPTPIINADKSVNEDVNRIFIGKAADFRTVRRDDTRAISYNPELGIIAVTFILDPASYGTNATDVGMCYSTDKGQTWSEPVVITDNGDAYVNDYPSGIIFNPDGNSNATDSYGVIQSISHQGSDWGYKMWSSMTLGGDNHQVEVSHNSSNIEDGYWNQFGLSQRGDQVRCLSMVPQGDWGNYQSAELQPITGDYDAGSFAWDESVLVEMDLYQNSDDGQMAWIGSYQGHDGGIDMAWSNDGQIGYMWMIGTSNDAATGYQPLIYRTEDAGESWDFVEVDFLTDEMQAFFDPYIITVAGESGLMIPSIEESCGTVDFNGNLQMLFVAGAHSSDVTQYPDSLGFSWQYPGDIFNLTVGADGTEGILWVDSLNTQNVVDATEGNYNANGWLHRITVAKNAAEDQIFVTWADTEDAANNENNIHPDIYGWSRNVEFNIESELLSFTASTLYETFYFFTYGAENAFYTEESDTYTVPYIQAVSPGEFASNGAGDPISFNYVTGIEFPRLFPDGINDLNSTSNITVTQNKPNPFNGSTNITVSTSVSTPVSIEVSNIMGQTIYTVNAGTINGTKEITLTSDDMEAGVYFYTVIVGNESITKKMIVK